MGETKAETHRDHGIGAGGLIPALSHPLFLIRGQLGFHKVCSEGTRLPQLRTSQVF